MLEIDGRHGEGGGQILRTSIVLSALTHTPCIISHIRANRSTPGLKPQHLQGLKAAAQICNAQTKGLELKSESVEFIPGTITGGNYNIEIGTAGSITLILQTLLPLCLHAPDPVVLSVTGGTDVKWSPTIAYFQKVVCWHLEQMGAQVHITVQRYGFYPRGGGRIKAHIVPWKQKKKINLPERGKIRTITIDSVASSSLKNPRVAQRQATRAEEMFSAYPIDPHVHYQKAANPGSSICTVAVCDRSVLGADSLGERGVPAEKVAEKAAYSLQEDLASGYALDSHMADQIVPYMALTGGSATATISAVTEHTRTNIWVCNQFMKDLLILEDHTLKRV
jgi:RNA 3'-phosphate cyclase